MKPITKHLILVSLLLSLLTIAACSTQTAPVGWQLHEPGGDTLCSGGTPYAFYTQQSSSSNLLVYFQAGGACPAGIPCAQLQSNLFDPTVVIPDDKTTVSGTFWDNDAPDEQAGIFDLTDERNPFIDYNIVYIPYCSADGHMGDALSADGALHHRGYINASSALDWAYANIEEPSQIVVAGSSAGGLATPFYAGIVADHYAGSRVVSIADSAGGYRMPLAPTFELWGMDSVLLSTPGYENLSKDSLSFETAYFVATLRHPEMKMVQFNTANDSTQQEFVNIFLGENAPPVADLLNDNLGDLSSELDNFSAYIADDSYHMILQNDRFFTESVDGQPFYQWVTDLISDKEIASVGVKSE